MWIETSRASASLHRFQRRLPRVLAIASLLLAACGPSRDAEIRAGRELFQGRGCAACHGPAGRGDGPLGARLVPRDLTQPRTFLRGASRDAIERTLDRGLPGGRMPAYSFLPSEERRLLALYVQSLGAPKTPDRR